MLTTRAGQRAKVLTYWANAMLLASLFLPASAELNRHEPVVYGWHILFLGVLGPLVFQFGWIGNLALPIAALSGSRWPRYICAIAFINSVFWRYVTDDAGEHRIVHLVGYYVWMAAMFVGALSLFWFESNGNERTGSKLDDA